MPIPKPKKGERKKAFISRCMKDSVMVKEYPDPAQRRAVCEGAWDKRNSALAATLAARGFTPCQIAIEMDRVGRARAD